MTSLTATPRRNVAARDAILDAAAALLGEHGYARLAVEQIAARARVGKQTIYRWWPSKSAILADCVLTGRIAPAGRPVPDTGDLRADLATWLDQLAALPDSAPQLVRGLVAAAAEDDRVREALYARLTGGEERHLARRLRVAHETEQTRADPDLAAEAIFGIMVYRLLIGTEPRPMALHEVLELI